MSEIKKHFNIKDIEYKYNGIVLKIPNCPEPVLLWSLNARGENFIEGYTDRFGKIDFSIDNNYDYYYNKQPDRKVFNQYLSDNLNDL